MNLTPVFTFQTLTLQQVQKQTLKNPMLINYFFKQYIHSNMIEVKRPIKRLESDHVTVFDSMTKVVGRMNHERLLS